MKLIIATDNRFWREIIASQKRIASLYRYLLSRGADIRVLFVGTLQPPDLEILAGLEDPPKLHVVPDSLANTNHADPPQPSISVKQFLPRRARKGLKTMANLWARRKLLFAALRDPVERSRIWLRAQERKLRDFVSPKHMALLAQMCVDDPPDLVLVEYVHLSYLADAIPPNASKRIYKIIDTHDLMHERQRRFHAMGELHHLDITPTEEAAALRKFDAVLAIQQTEARKFRELVPDRPVVVVGMTSRITPLPVRDAKDVRLAFFGSAMPPNRLSVEFILRTIWPRLRARFSESIFLDIYGTVCEQFRTRVMPPGVALKGFVDDLENAYRDTDIVLSPVFFGGGLKLKTVEALCFTRPLVTTTLGAEGLEDGIGFAFLAHDSMEEFVQAVEGLIQDVSARRRMAEAAHTYALRHFTPEATYGPLDQLLKEWGLRPLTGEALARAWT